MDTTLSNTISLLRFPLALLVIYLHIDQIPYNITFDNILQGNVGYAIYNLSKISIVTFASIAVPCFFIISGYLFFYKIESYSFSLYSQKLKQKVRSLLVPYIIFNILAVAYIYVTQGITLKSISEIFWNPANFPLWFLRDLMILTLCSPLIYLFAKYCKMYGLILLTAIYICNLTPAFASQYANISLYFFYLGCYWGTSKFRLQNINSQTVKVLQIISILLYIVSVIVWGKHYDILKNCFILICSMTIILSVYAYVSRHNLNQKNILLKLAPAAFFIYLFHKIGPTAMSKIPFSFMPDSYITDTAMFWICPIITAIICILIYALLDKFMPGLLTIMTGRKRCTNRVS